MKISCHLEACPSLVTLPPPPKTPNLPVQNYERTTVVSQKSDQSQAHQSLHKLSKPIADVLIPNSKTTRATLLSINEPFPAIESGNTPKTRLGTQQSANNDFALSVRIDNTTSSSRSFIPANPSVQPPIFTIHWSGTENSDLDALTHMLPHILVAGGSSGIGGPVSVVSPAPDNQTQAQNAFFSDEGYEDFLNEIEVPAPPDVPVGSIRQYIPINADNDRHASVTPYQSNPPGTSYGRFYPDNYEYDFKTTARTADENDVLLLTQELINPGPIPIGTKIEWKLQYTPRANAVPRVRFWDTGKKDLQLTPSDDWQFLPTDPGVFPQGRLPGPYVEGIDPSNAIDDAGTVTWSIRYTLMDNSTTVVTYKPVVLTITPVLDKFANFTPHTVKAFVWENPKSPGTYNFAAKAYVCHVSGDRLRRHHQGCTILGSVYKRYR